MSRDGARTIGTRGSSLGGYGDADLPQGRATLSTLTIALAKGRILDETLPLFAKAGIVADEDPETSRKLILATSDANVRFLMVRPSDVPTYVQYGAADAGIAGKDVLLEHGKQY